ncbi:MAG: cell division protein ZapA [Burkholderiales bacterium]|jgi:cell division protein ZapA|nr:cell division protein ZapA [Burkholderiales bacterium]
MSDKKGVLDVTILGRSYKVSCSDDEREELLEAVTYLDGKMHQIKASGKVGGTERIAVMAALNIAHEYLTAKTPGGFDIATLKRRIDAMQATLEQAIAPQEKLF